MGFSVKCSYFKQKMEDSYFHELKKQAFFFFKENFKIARLALTDVTRAQLMTEEATSGNPWPPDSPTMREITRAAFEVDDFYRIVEILHKRLEKFEAKDWRASYNAVILLEHVLTRGPHSFAEEFEDTKQVLREMDGFHFVDEKGFNWGQSVRKISVRVLKLLEDEEFLRQERINARNLTRGIQGFGNLSRRSFPTTVDLQAGRFNHQKLNSKCTDLDRRSDMKNDLSPGLASEILLIDAKEEERKEDLKRRLKEKADSESGLRKDCVNTEVDHPFSETKHHQVSQSLL